MTSTEEEVVESAEEDDEGEGVWLVGEVGTDEAEEEAAEENCKAANLFSS
jgi:succinyl-CoA synthetase alpha subunit